MKRPIITERMFLYWTDREHPNTCRMTVRMQDTIELTMMQEALRQTQARYPYYSVRLSVTLAHHPETGFHAFPGHQCAFCLPL